MSTSDPPTKRNFSSTQNLIWKNGGKESKFYVKKIICTHETVLKNTKIDKNLLRCFGSKLYRAHNFTNGEPK